MPSELLEVHNRLNKAVNPAYRPKPFPSEVKRMEILFELYEHYTSEPI